MKKNLLTLRSGPRAEFRKQLWIVLAITLTVASNLQAQKVGAIAWGPSQPYDVGYNPSVAGSSVGYMLEVHNGQSGVGNMWYHVGQASWGWPSPVPSITWSPYELYD